MGRKLGLCSPFGEGSWFPILHNVAWAEAYLYTKWHLDPCSRMATVDMGRKMGALPPSWGGGAGSLTNTMLFGLRYLHTKWHLDPSSRLGTIDITWAENWEALPPIWELGPHLTQCRVRRGLPSYQVAS